MTARRRSLRSAWPGPVSCRKQALWVNSAVVMISGYLGGGWLPLRQLLVLQLLLRQLANHGLGQRGADFDLHRHFVLADAGAQEFLDGVRGDAVMPRL